MQELQQQYKTSISNLTIVNEGQMQAHQREHAAKIEALKQQQKHEQEQHIALFDRLREDVLQQQAVTQKHEHEQPHAQACSMGSANRSVSHCSDVDNLLVCECAPLDGSE